MGSREGACVHVYMPARRTCLHACRRGKQELGLQERVALLETPLRRGEGPARGLRGHLWLPAGSTGAEAGRGG